MTHRRAFIVTVVLATLGASHARAERVVLKKTAGYELQYDSATGLLCHRLADGTAVLPEIGSSVEIQREGWVGSYSTPRPTGGQGLVRGEFTDALGKGEVVSLPSWSDPNSSFRLTTTVRLYSDQSFYVMGSRLDVTGTEELRVARLAPFDVAGGLNLDSDPSQVWLMENGNGMVLDFYVRRMQSNRPTDSNGNLLAYAPRTDRGLVVGFLSHATSMTGIKTGLEYGEPTKIKRLVAQCDYIPPRPLKSQETMEAEAGVYVEVTQGQPLVAAERWARSVARVGGYRVTPAGNIVKWNPWAARYSHGVDEENMCREMDAAAEKLLPYGMSYFHLDSDWERTWGDWEANSKFPHGMKYMADRMHRLGFKSSIWIAPFAANRDSDLAKQHPTWFAAKSPLGQRLIEKDRGALDLSKPEVREWLSRLFGKMANEWGFDCFKIDFIYYSLACGNFSDKSKTYIESYRAALEAIHKAVGPDRKVLCIGVPLVQHAGRADIMRIGLDNKPAWDKGNSAQGQGIRTSVRTLARRYYLNGNIWVNHPDCLYVGDPETARRWGCAPITLQEARAWNSLCGLTGGVLCIGDSIVSLQGDTLDMMRRIMPQYESSARPLDLFEHFFPELWNLQVDRDFERWNVLGVFHWGDNDRWGEAMADSPRTYSVRFADLGLPADADFVVHEFWQDRYVGVRRGGFEVPMEPHSCQVFSIRRAEARPQVVGMNRHLTQGGVEVESLRWDAESKTLACTQKLIGGWDYLVTLRVPGGWSQVGVPEFTGPAGRLELGQKMVHVGGETWKLRYRSSETVGRASWNIRFGT